MIVNIVSDGFYLNCKKLSLRSKLLSIFIVEFYMYVFFCLRKRHWSCFSALSVHYW